MTWSLQGQQTQNFLHNIASSIHNFLTKSPLNGQQNCGRNSQLHNSGESSNITKALPWSNHTSADICKAQHLYFYLPWGESDCYNTSSAFTDILQTVYSLASQLWYGMTAEVNSNTRQTDVERTAENSHHWPIKASCWRQQWSRW